MAALITVALLGREHGLRTPGYADREDLLVAWHGVQPRDGDDEALAGRRILRVLAAAIGLCTRLGGEAGQDYASSGCRPLEYGGRMYAWLVEQGATAEEIVDAGGALLKALQELPAFPARKEVAAKKVFSEGGEAPTAPPSPSR